MIFRRRKKKHSLLYSHICGDFFVAVVQSDEICILLQVVLLWRNLMGLIWFILGLGPTLLKS